MNKLNAVSKGPHPL